MKFNIETNRFIEVNGNDPFNPKLKESELFNYYEPNLEFDNAPF
jgi:hypothetical protein